MPDDDEGKGQEAAKDLAEKAKRDAAGEASPGVDPDTSESDPG